MKTAGSKTSVYRLSLTKAAVALAVTMAAILAGQFTAQGQEADKWRTSSALVGESKYGETFKQYDYVNPNAPKGGTLNSVAPGTYDSFNPYIVRGTPAAGLSPFLGGLLYDTLMDRSVDEGSVSHALVADAYKYPPDFSSATYRLDPRAKWQDGKPITVDDVIWSFQFLKTNSPYYVRYFENVKEAVALNDREVEFRFDQKGNRELPKILGDLSCCRSTGGKARTPRARSATSINRHWSRRLARGRTRSRALNRVRKLSGRA